MKHFVHNFNACQVALVLKNEQMIKPNHHPHSALSGSWLRSKVCFKIKKLWNAEIKPASATPGALRGGQFHKTAKTVSSVLPSEFCFHFNLFLGSSVHSEHQWAKSGEIGQPWPECHMAGTDTGSWPPIHFPKCPIKISAAANLSFRRNYKCLPFLFYHEPRMGKFLLKISLFKIFDCISQFLPPSLREFQTIPISIHGLYINQKNENLSVLFQLFIHFSSAKPCLPLLSRL